MEKSLGKRAKIFLLPFLVAVLSTLGILSATLQGVETSLSLGEFKREIFLDWGQMACVIILFFMGIIHLRIYKKAKKIRIFIVAVVFFMTSYLHLLVHIQWEEIFSGTNKYAVELTLFYGLLQRFVLSVGLFISAAVPFDRGISKSSQKSIWAFFSFFILGTTVLKLHGNFFLISLGSQIDFETWALNIEFIGVLLLSMVIINHLKMYFLEEKSTSVLMLTGILLLEFSQVMWILFPKGESIFYTIHLIYAVLGYSVYLMAAVKKKENIFGENWEKTERQILMYSENLEKIVDKRTKEIRKVNMRLIQELEYAKTIQQSLLPQRNLSFRTAVFASAFFPCERLSGDFYDIYRIDENNVGMYVLDVSGHGISAALMTMFCNNFIKSTEHLIKRYRGLKPHRNLKHFYDEFNKMNFPEEMHMVIFFASYNVESKILTYCTGGMNCIPIVCRATGEIFYLDDSQGFPICQMTDFFIPEYESNRTQLFSGDRVIFYTDGLVDKLKNNVMDQEELLEILKTHSCSTLSELSAALESHILPQAESLEDDITYFIMEV